MSSKKFYAVSFLLFLAVMALLTILPSLLTQSQQQPVTVRTMMLETVPQQPIYQLVSQQKSDLVEVEELIFYQLAKEIFDSCKTVKDRLRAINDLKAVSKKVYFELYAQKKITYADINKLRAAAYYGRKKAEKEFGINF